MLPFLLWYISITLIGLLAFPLAYRLLPALADRGYAFSRSLGLLVWGFVFWMLASLGVLRNDLGGLLLALAVLIAMSLWAYRSLGKDELFGWWTSHKRLVFIIEALFLVAFAGWAFVRAAHPEILNTEKPMELAFINAILNSPNFPPHDPWLSGYAISYYHFGYILVAMLAKITAVPGSYAFNLGISLVFALSATGAYGLVHTLLQSVYERRNRSDREGGNLLGALSGPVFLLIAGNLEGLLEVLHARGLFWRQDSSGQLISAFWSWLDMKELSLPPAQPLSWLPTRFLWWWRASRVVQDYDLAGNWREVIDEFPAFSYLLADLHPHVLAMPFALLAVAITLNLFLGGAQGAFRWLGLRLNLSPISFAFAAVSLGGLAFLNTWDFPIYLFLFCSAYILRQEWVGPSEVSPEKRESSPSLFTRVKQFLALAVALGLTSIILYLPFYLGFSSQAGGFLPNLIYPTRGAHLWVMFGAFFFLMFAYLIYIWRVHGDKATLIRGVLIAAGITLTLWFLAIFFGAIIASLPVLGDLFIGSLGGATTLSDLILAAIGRRLASFGWITLTILLGLGLGLILVYIRRSNVGLSPVHSFVLLMVVSGVLLVIFTEFFYLRDQFSSRINTIFKFYYQAWILWSIAAAFGTIYLLRELRSLWGWIYRLALAGIIVAVMVYPTLLTWEMTSGFTPPGGYSLDGASHLAASSPDDMAGINWLRNAPPGVVLEAVGGQYSEYGRVATYSGRPTVLGWPGHESQWRGGNEEMGSRQEDVERVYLSNNWEDTRMILELYSVRYVFVGTLERNTYPVNEEKFMRFLEPVFSQGGVTIYEVPWAIELSVK